MRRTLSLLAVLALATACADAGHPVAVDPGTPDLAAGGGNPHFQVNGTKCTATSEPDEIACGFKAVGLASGSTLTVLMEATAVVEFTCKNPANHFVKGWTDRQKVGEAQDTYGPVAKNGSISGALNGELDFPGRNALCPGNGNWTLHHWDFLNIQWTMTGTGYNKGGPVNLYANGSA